MTTAPMDDVAVAVVERLDPSRMCKRLHCCLSVVKRETGHDFISRLKVKVCGLHVCCDSFCAVKRCRLAIFHFDWPFPSW